MTFSTLNDVLAALLRATREHEVKGVLDGLGDRSDLTIDQEFGPFSLCWHPFGNNPSNISTINLGTKPGRSLTERLTNATDAILEDRFLASITAPRSARDAAKQWFGRPVTGPDDGLYKWDFRQHDLDRRIAVVISQSGREGAPTVDVVDDGIGIKPELFPGTILSLQSGNKIQKWYLVGAFGQGGASTLAFCEYALIVSRSRDDAKRVGFTVVRVLRLNEQYKEDTYAFMAIKRTDGKFEVPAAICDAGEYMLYPENGRVKLPSMKKGTLIRHYSYKLPYLDGTLSPGPRNLYHYLHCSMFDPILPFRVIDVREEGKEKDELVTGSRNRLMSYAAKKGTLPVEGESDEEKRTVLKHYRPMEYISPFGTDNPCIGIEYWVVFNYKKAAKKDELILRPNSNELFVQTGHPIVGCLNGQNQGELTAQIFRDLNLGLVSRHIVIHVDGTNADRRVRRELFATTREGFKDGDILSSILQVLRRMLGEDSQLMAIEAELNAKLAQREAESTNEEVKRQVTRLLQDAGLVLSREGPTTTPGEGEFAAPKEKKTIKRPVVPDPLPTLPFPQVTRFEIVTPKPKMEIRQNDVEVVLVETDADAEFDKRSMVAIRTEPPFLEIAAKNPLRGGRIRWRLRPRADAKVGETGKIIIALTKPDGAQLTDSTDFEIRPPAEEKAKKIKGLIPPFEIIAINPDDNPEEWATVWPHFKDDATPEDLATVGYKPVRTAGQINVYYSEVFSPFKQAMVNLGSDRPALIDLFLSNYEVWIGYHAILQENGRGPAPEKLEMDEFEQILEQDRVRVAQMQVRQALRTADLMHKTMQAQAAASG